MTTHYFPTLYQNQFEFEDGYTPSGAHVRYQFDESLFPNFSKRGYAKFSSLQNEVLSEVNIFRSSVYRMVIRYVNPTDENIVAKILITSDNPSEVDQHAKILFKPTQEPQFVTVSGAKGDIPSPIVLDPGRYTISVQTDKYLFLDYFVLLPAAYYEATILTKKIENPCELGNLNLCRHYKYPSINEFGPVHEPYITGQEKAVKPDEYYTDSEHLKLVHENNLPALSADQSKLSYLVDVPRTGRYIIVVDYITDRNYPDTSIINVNLADSDQGAGVVTLYPCTYTTVCRQPVIDDESREKIFHVDNTVLKAVEIQGDGDSRVAIKSVTAIPIHEWSIDLITPSPVCVIKDGKCVPATFRTAPDSKKVMPLLFIAFFLLLETINRFLAVPSRLNLNSKTKVEWPHQILLICMTTAPNSSIWMTPIQQLKFVQKYRVLDDIISLSNSISQIMHNSIFCIRSMLISFHTMEN